MGLLRWWQFNLLRNMRFTTHVKHYQREARRNPGFCITAAHMLRYILRSAQNTQHERDSKKPLVVSDFEST